jgi:phosphatidylserine decarboxylase
MLRLLKFLPRVFISRIVGRLARIQSPRFLVVKVLFWFAKKYQINSNLNEFFTRRLKNGLRKIEPGFIIHPADSRITQFGKIQDGTLIQAKGHTYQLAEFIGNEDRAKKYQDGFFIVYYLCPTDYHRVHAPVEGTIKEIKKMGFDLWPVNDASVEQIPNLFIQNERVLVSISSQLGSAEVVFVGATNVGQIEIFKKESDFIEKGEELGVFHMGSTVVVIYPKSFKVDLEKMISAPVKIGGVLAQFKNPWDQ